VFAIVATGGVRLVSQTGTLTRVFEISVSSRGRLAAFEVVTGE